jgi:hypothetical protein
MKGENKMTKELLEKIKEIEEKLGQEWMKELESLKTVEELKKKATELKIELTEEQAMEALKLLSDETEELNEEELAAVAGGKRVTHLIN